MESRPMSLSSTAITSTSMGRGESSSSESQASTTDTLLTSIDEYPHDDGNSYTGECFKTFTSKQHQTRLSPPKTYAATNDADATETLYRDDPPSHLEPYRTPSPLRTSPFLVLRSHESPLTNRRQRTSLQPDSPATPIRRRSAKDLIDHFESQSASPSRSAPCSTPTNNSSNTAPSTAPPRFPPSEARLNGPLPAIPLPEPKMAPSPSRSPLRSLINMMKGKKRNKQRSPSPSPVPKRRAMLDDEDGQPPRLLYDTTLNTAPASAQTMSLGNLKPDDADVVMRAGPLLYASSTSARTEWYRTQAVLQAPTLTLDLASDPGGSTPFRSFNLRHATVESLPSTTLSKEIVRDLGFEVESESDGVTMYVFELNLQDEPGGQRKERFASASPWDRGKWVCHLWDAICSANASTYSDFNPPMDEISPVNGTLASKYEDPEFHRLQPPLRVVNVSKLSAFFEANDSQSPSRREHRPSPLQFSTPIDSTTVSAAAYYGLRSAPTAEYPKAGSSTDPYPGPDTPRKTKSVPATPSVDNLGNLSLVQKRLARLQSQKSSLFHRPTEEEASGSQARLNGLSTPPISPGKRQQSKPLSTIRVGGDVNNSLGRRETAMSTPTHESRNLSTRIGTDNGTDVRGSSPLPSSPLFHRSVKHLSSKLGEGRTTKTYMTDEESLEHGRRQFNYDAPIMNSTLPIAAQPNTTSQPVAMLRSQDQSSTTTLSEPSVLYVEPSRDYSDFNIAPTLALVKNAALDQAAQTKALALALQSIQEQLSEVKTWGTTADNTYTEESLAKTKREAESDVKKGVLEIKQKVETVLTSFADRYQQQNGIEAGVEEIRAKLESLTSSDNTIRNLSAANNSSSSNELPFLIQQVSEQLRLNQESEKEGEALLEKISTTVDVVNEGAAADRLIWGTHFAELKDTLSILGTSANTSQLEETLVGIKDALDGLRNDVTSGKKKESEPQLPLPDRSVFSVFRNKPASGQTLAEPAPLDLSALQQKLDAISTTAATPDMAPVNDKLDVLLALCREAAEKANVVKMGDEGNTNSKNSTEEGKIDLSGLLSHLQEDQVHREKYYTELNSWLSNTASQTGTQYHAIATQLQALHQLFAPSEDIGGDSLQADGSSDSSRPNNLLREIQNALVENNNRNRTNDNFLAAANHLISTASTERQNLIELIGRQRDENEKLLEKFAETIAMEIRGEKHRFVDAMEKATAINVEAQLQELKGQISVQLISMAKEVERLRDERKSLEHQIAELLTFKNRFGVWNHQIPPTNSSSTAPIRQNPQEPVYLPHTPVHPQSPMAVPPLPTNRRTANHRPLPTPGPNVHYGQPFIPQNGQYL